MKSAKYNILVVDDEEMIRNLMTGFLKKMGYSYQTASDGIGALDVLKANQVDAVVTDVRMPKMDGIDLTMAISKQYPSIPVMIATAFGEEYSIGTAISVGAREFIQKPFSYFEFVIRLRKMIHDSEFFRRKRITKGEDKQIEKLRNELEEFLKAST